MEYRGYKKIHRKNTRSHRRTLVEWPNGGVTLDTMTRHGRSSSWSGASVFLSDMTAKWLLGTLRRIYGRRRRR